METFLMYFLFALGLGLIIKGGDVFVNAASEISTIFGIPKFIIGATIVSIATTLPELIVSVLATFEGSTEMAIGNAVGSVTVNTGFIMSIGVLFLPCVLSKKEFSAKAIIFLVSVTSLLLFSINGNLNIIGSIAMLGIFIVFIYENIRSAKAISGSDTEEKPEKNNKDIAKNILFFVIGAVCIVIGSRLLVDKGTLIAKSIGISERIISITAVAIGTSLPELVTTVSAIVKKQASLSVGNVVGANIIDTCLILPVCSLIGGGTLPVKPESITLDLPICLLEAAIMMVPSLITKRFYRLQAIIAIIVYIAYIVVSMVL